ncbi:hypothetical protein MMC13_005292 [Lambiella insularis]|nr:hypothetical protein [Lambiella insularis]
MAIIDTWLPPSREHWELLNWLWQFFPLVTLAQWGLDYFFNFYPQGKSSIVSPLNLPGKVGWFSMEVPGFITLLYIMWTLPKELGLAGLPGVNWLMAALFVNSSLGLSLNILTDGLQTVHYIYRAILAPLVLNPSMSPIHITVWCSAFSFQVINATCIGGWLGGYGPTTDAGWAGKYLYIQAGMMIFALGLFGNIYHDDELREIRRSAARQQAKKAKEQNEQGKPKGEGVAKVYQIPQNGLFKYILFPHYLCEWIEWCGFWIIGGLACTPARSFVLNEVATMTARASMGWRWYVKRFGREKIGSRKAVIPGLF